MLAKSATSSFNWNLGGSITRTGASFLINMVLARILGPEPFGLVAVAGIFISIGNLIIDSGLNSGLIQKKEINNKDIQFVSSIQLILALVLCGLIISLAPLIAKIYNSPAVTPVLQILTISLFFQAASQTSTALLIRKMAFKRIQQAQIISYLVGYLGIGLPLAFLGYGVWSLVFSQMTQSLIYLCFSYGAVRHPLGLVVRGSEAISRFGINMLGINIGHWIVTNYDNTSIGWAYGTTNLGLYNRAWSLAMVPVGLVVMSCHGILFSASSKLQESSERVKDVFTGVFTLIGITLFPFSLCESLVANDIVQLVYGDKWHPAGPILAVLAIAMPFFALMAIQGPVMAGLGKPQIEVRLQWIVVGFTGIIFMFVIQFSMQMIVWSVFVIYLFRFFIFSLTNFKILGISKKDIKWVLISIITFSSLVTLFVFITKQFTVHLGFLLRLIIQGDIGIFVWIVVFIIGWKHFLPIQFKNLANHIIPKRLLTLLERS